MDKAAGRFTEETVPSGTRFNIPLIASSGWNLYVSQFAILAIYFVPLFVMDIFIDLANPRGTLSVTMLFVVGYTLLLVPFLLMSWKRSKRLRTSGIIVEFSDSSMTIAVHSGGREEKILEEQYGEAKGFLWEPWNYRTPDRKYNRRVREMFVGFITNAVVFEDTGGNRYCIMPHGTEDEMKELRDVLNARLYEFRTRGEEEKT